MIESWKKDKLLAGFSHHFMNEINSTLPYYPLLMYIFIRAHDQKQILEVGIEEGYSTYYLAHAAKMSGGMYYGIDINQESCDNADRELTKAGLPHKIICADTKEIEKIDFMDRIDFAFLDGEHTTEAVLHEIELIYPLLNGRGRGYVFIHDIVDMGNAGAWLKLKHDERFETLGMEPNYGLGIARKIEGLDYEDTARKYEIKSNFMKRWEILEDLINRNHFKNIAGIGVKESKITKHLLEHCDLEEYITVGEDFNEVLKPEMYADKTFDLIYIDADQRYESVIKNIKDWMPKVKTGGIICGNNYYRLDDKPDSQVTSAVREIFGQSVNLISDESPNGNHCVWWKYVPEP